VNYLYLAFVLGSVGRVTGDDDLPCHVYIDRWSVRRVGGQAAENNSTIFLFFVS